MPPPRTKNAVLMGWRDEEDTSAQQAIPIVSRIKSKDVLPEEKHWSQKGLEEMTERDWRILREDLGITLQAAPADMPPPLRSWQEAKPLLGHRLLRLIEQAGYREPTPVQRVTIPLLCASRDRDVIALAETGSGKTAAFVLPMLRRILLLEDELEDRRGSVQKGRDYQPLRDDGRGGGPGLPDEYEHPVGLILVPTRELALQIEEEAAKFARPLGIGVLAIVGGQSLAQQSVRMMRGVRLVVATPGRLRDCLEQHVLTLEGIQAIVLDEADRMIDLNYEEDLQWILAQTLPDPIARAEQRHAAPSRTAIQRWMFSATMPVEVERLAQSYLQPHPVRVSIGQAGQVVERVEQRLLWCTAAAEEKPKRLLEIINGFDFETLATPVPGPILIFVNHKATVDAVVARLQAHGHRAVGLHGGRSQDQREQAMAQVRGGRQDILVATDVAGRGLDIPNIPLVINYDMSPTIEAYVHRVGRTGRAGAQGRSITLLTEADAPLFSDLKQLLLKSPAGMNGVPVEFAQHPATRAVAGQPARPRQDNRVFAYGLQ